MQITPLFNCQSMLQPHPGFRRVQIWVVLHLILIPCILAAYSILKPIHRPKFLSYPNKIISFFAKHSSVALPSRFCTLSDISAGKSDHRPPNNHSRFLVSSNRVLLDDDCIRTSLPSLTRRVFDASPTSFVISEMISRGKREGDEQSCKSVSSGTLPTISF